MRDGARLALTTLTVLPVRGPEQLDRRTAGRAMSLAPIVGLLLGLLCGVLVYLLRKYGGSDLLAATVGITLLAVLTRGLHLDGLADVVDGLASYRDPEGTRAVMRAPDLGPLGAIALVCSTLLQVTALAACLGHGRGTADLVLAVITSRLALTWLCSGPAAATAEGLGSTVAGTVHRWVPVVWTAGLATAAAAYALIDPDGQGDSALRATQAGLVPLLALTAVALLLRHVLRRVGGVTGDVLGAAAEATMTLCLVLLALDPGAG